MRGVYVKLIEPSVNFTQGHCSEISYQNLKA